jgi:uncharacterized protein YdeI (YjbR/CyaY-like superfamily)
VNPEVDTYLQTARWADEISALRPILSSRGLTEEIKWRQPCYTHQGKNIVILQEMKDFLSLMFFKGALLSDPAGVLEPVGPNARSARRIRFTSTHDVERLADVVADYVDEAIEVERRGLDVGPAPEPDPPEELVEWFEQDPDLKEAFESLTPGRRREYILYFSSAKRPDTRRSRIERHIERIKSGLGLRER